MKMAVDSHFLFKYTQKIIHVIGIITDSELVTYFWQPEHDNRICSFQLNVAKSN